jgi:hypothetical protein
MSERAIDYDRGVVIRIVNDLNMEVFMYKDTPGIYLNAYGQPVPEVLAAQAGFDVERLRAGRVRRERMAQAAAAIEKETSEFSPTRIVVEEKEGYRIVSLGAGRHFLEDADGHNLTPGTYLTDALAKRVLDDMATAARNARIAAQKATPKGSVAAGPAKRPGAGTAGSGDGAGEVAAA